MVSADSVPSDDVLKRVATTSFSVMQTTMTETLQATVLWTFPVRLLPVCPRKKSIATGTTGYIYGASSVMKLLMRFTRKTHYSDAPVASSVLFRLRSALTMGAYSVEENALAGTGLILVIVALLIPALVALVGVLLVGGVALVVAAPVGSLLRPIRSMPAGGRYTSLPYVLNRRQ